MVWNHIIWFAAIYMVANHIYGKIPYNQKFNLTLYGHIYGHIVWSYIWSTIYMLDPWTKLHIAVVAALTFYVLGIFIKSYPKVGGAETIP